MRRIFLSCLLIIFAVIAGGIFTNGAFAEALTVFSADADGNAAPSASTTIVISQAYGGGGGATGTYIYDYVELKNISSTPQSLNGLALVYGSATGQFASSASNLFALPDVTLQPGQYYLVQLSTAGTGGAPLPVTPDVATTNLSMSGTNGKVALVTSSFTPNSCGATATPCPLPNPNIIDLVSWGTANNAEGGASTNGGTALTATQGNVRKDNGCTDTDNNNNDFEIVTAPVPRNSASPAEPCGGTTAPGNAEVDFNGDGRSDFVVTRDVSGQMTWFIQNSGSGSLAVAPFGLPTDRVVPEDFDGDGKDDVAVWRENGNPTPDRAYFFILRSSDNTLQIEQIGTQGDDPSIVGDYDGDGKADVAVFRPSDSVNVPCSPGASVWYYRPSSEPGVDYRYQCWGKPGDIPTPGDFDGDGRKDFAVQRNEGGSGLFFIKSSGTGIEESIVFGLGTDVYIPGDYDGDGKDDIAVRRTVSGSYHHFILTRGSGTVLGPIVWGITGDISTPGDYDGDGKTDIAVFRPSADPNQNFFYVRQSGSSSLLAVKWGIQGDQPAASFRVH